MYFLLSLLGPNTGELMTIQAKRMTHQISQWVVLTTFKIDLPSWPLCRFLLHTQPWTGPWIMCGQLGTYRLAAQPLLYRLAAQIITPPDCHCLKMCVGCWRMLNYSGCSPQQINYSFCGWNLTTHYK